MNESNNSVTKDADNATTLDPVINNKIDTEDLNDSQDKLLDVNSPTESETSPKSKRIPLTIRCPFTTTDLNIYIDPSHNVLHLKKKIYKEFPSNPKPSDQRLIFGGRIIQNNEILQDVLKRQLYDLSTPPTIHLIINSLAIQHAKTVKPNSSNNSENVSSNNTPDASVQNSPVNSMQNLNESTNITNNTTINNNNTTNDATANTNISNNAKEVQASTSTNEPKSSDKLKPSTNNSNETLTIKQRPSISPDGVQYILLNNVIYAVQPAPELLIAGESGFKLQTPMDFRSNTDSDEIFEINNSNNNSNNTNADQNNNNNNNNAQPEADNANANNNNGQQEILNQILNDNDQQRQRPNQFFLFIRLAFIVYLLTQGGGYIRMFIVTLIAIIIFLVQTGRISVRIINYRDLPGVNAENNNNNNNVNQNEQANNDNNNNDNNANRDINNEAGDNENEPLLNNDGNNNEDGNNNNNNENNNLENVVPQYSFLTNCRRVFFAFFLSLIPFIQDVA